MPRSPLRPASKFRGWLVTTAGLAGLTQCSVYESALLSPEATGASGAGGTSAVGASAGQGSTAGAVGANGATGGGGVSAGTAAGGEAPSPAGAAAGGTGPTCADGELNGDEVEIDCGGSCESACPEKLCSELVAGPTLETVLAGDALVGWYRFHDGQDLGADSSSSDNTASALEVAQASDPGRGCVAVFKGTSSLVLTPSVTADMTIALWLRTDVAGLGAIDKHWYDGSSLLNAEQPGMVNDFGLTLLADEIAFGVGNPDLTLHGGSALNDDTWHHLVATRDDESGEMVLFIDGVEQGRADGPVGARDAASALGVGWNHLVGRIADLRLYDSVLTGTQVSELFAGK